MLATVGFDEHHGGVFDAVEIANNIVCYVHGCLQGHRAMDSREVTRRE